MVQILKELFNGMKEFFLKSEPMIVETDSEMDTAAHVTHSYNPIVVECQQKIECHKIKAENIGQNILLLSLAASFRF